MIRGLYEVERGITQNPHDVSLFAALAGCAAGSIVLFHELQRSSFVALPFTCAGSLLLLAPLYASARENGVTIAQRYARLLIAGSGAGALILDFISLLINPAMGAGIGAAYGALTASCWIAIHGVTKRLFS